MSRADNAFRVIAAPAAKLYAAFVDPEALAAWLPPEGMTGEVDLFEPRAGGKYRMILRYDEPDGGVGKTDADTDLVEGVFVELVPGVRIVQRASFESDDPSMAGTMTITWRFDSVPEGTRVTIACEDVPAGIRRKDHLAGLRSTLSNLAAYAE